MIFWMGEQAQDLQNQLRVKAGSALSSGQSWGLGLLAFLSVLREGIETVLFLVSTSESTPLFQVVTGALLGIFISLLLAVFLLRGLLRINLHKFFTWTAYILIVFGAGILGKATAALQAAGWLPGTIST